MKYNVTEIEINDRPEYGIQLVESSFDHIMFKYGAVKFDEKEDNGLLHFEYDVVEGTLKEDEKDQFEKAIGDLLIEMIKQGIEDRSLVYKGGTDED